MIIDPQTRLIDKVEDLSVFQTIPHEVHPSLSPTSVQGQHESHASTENFA